MEIGRGWGRCGAWAEDRGNNPSSVVKHTCQYHIDLFEPGKERDSHCIFL